MLGHDPNADIALLRVDPEGPGAAAAAARRQREGRGRRAGRGDRVAVRAGAVALGRDRLGDRPLVASLTDFRDLGRDPDRRRDQPGQLRRAAGRLRRARDRHQPADPVAARAAARASASRCRSTSSSARSTQLREDGNASYAYLGVTSTPLYPQLVEHFDLDVDKGAWVQAVNPGGPAEEAGLRGGSGRSVFQGRRSGRGGDVITKRRRPPVDDADDLSAAIARFKPGETADVEIHRGGETQREGQARRAPAWRPLAAVSLSLCSSPSALAHKSLADYTHIVGRDADRRDPRARRAAEGAARRAPLGDRVRRRRLGDPLHARAADARRRPRGRVAGDLRPATSSSPPRSSCTTRSRATRRTSREEQWATWRRYNEMNARELSRGWDVCIVHDPQPAAIRAFAPEKARALGLALPHRRLDAEPGDDGAAAARTSLGYGASLFHVDGYVPAGMNGGVNVVPPAIDPLTPKNMALSHDDAVYVCRQFGIDVNRPMICQVSRFDPWKDPLGVIDAYRIVKERAAGRAARAGRLDGLRRPGGLGLLQRDDRARRRRSRTSTSSTTSTTSARSRSTPSSRSPTS